MAAKKKTTKTTKATSKKKKVVSLKKKTTKKKVVASSKPKKKGRRTNDQLCSDLRNERGRLYTKRARLVKSPKTTKNDLEYSRIENRLDAIREQLFRCGKKFSNFKKQRTKLRRHQYYLQSKIENLRARLTDKTLTKKEIAEIKKEINVIGIYKLRTGEKIRMIERTMNLPIGNVKSSSGIDKGVVSVSGGKFVVQDIIWKMTESWHKWLSSGYFYTLVLDNEIYDIEENPMIATAAVYQAYDWAMAWQHVYGTPFFFAFGHTKKGYLEIKVKEYTTDMYANEIAQHGDDIEEQ